MDELSFLSAIAKRDMLFEPSPWCPIYSVITFL